MELNYISYKNPPKLVEKDLKKFYITQYKINHLKQIKNNSNDYIYIIKQYLKYILVSIFNFIKEYYGFFILLTLISILLYIRYIEIYNRKKKIKKIIKYYNLDNEDNY